MYRPSYSHTGEGGRWGIEVKGVYQTDEDVVLVRKAAQKASFLIFAFFFFLFFFFLVDKSGGKSQNVGNKNVVMMR